MRNNQTLVGLLEAGASHPACHPVVFRNHSSSSCSGNVSSVLMHLASLWVFTVDSWLLFCSHANLCHSAVRGPCSMVGNASVSSESSKDLTLVKSGSLQIILVFHFSTFHHLGGEFSVIPTVHDHSPPMILPPFGKYPPSVVSLTFCDSSPHPFLLAVPHGMSW